MSNSVIIKLISFNQYFPLTRQNQNTAVYVFEMISSLNDLRQTAPN